MVLLLMQLLLSIVTHSSILILSFLSSQLMDYGLLEGQMTFLLFDIVCCMELVLNNICWFGVNTKF